MPFSGVCAFCAVPVSCVVTDEVTSCVEHSWHTGLRQHLDRHSLVMVQGERCEDRQARESIPGDSVLREEVTAQSQSLQESHEEHQAGHINCQHEPHPKQLPAGYCPVSVSARIEKASTKQATSTVGMNSTYQQVALQPQESGHSSTQISC